MKKLAYLLVITVISKILVEIGLIGIVLAATEDYRLSFDEYRASYSDYEVKQADFGRLKTFAAEEAYVTSAREMLRLRSQTWLAYWQNSVSQIDKINNFTQEQKDFWQKYLVVETNRLNDNSQVLMIDKTLGQLAATTNEINQQKDNYYKKAFEINVEIIYGNLLDATLELKKINQELFDKASAQSIEETKKESVMRGLRSNLDKLGSTEVNLMVLRNDFLEKADGSNIDDLESITLEFMPEYNQLTQIMSLTQELAEVVTW